MQRLRGSQQAVFRDRRGVDAAITMEGEARRACEAGRAGTESPLKRVIGKRFTVKMEGGALRLAQRAAVVPVKMIHGEYRGGKID